MSSKQAVEILKARGFDVYESPGQVNALGPFFNCVLFEEREVVIVYLDHQNSVKNIDVMNTRMAL